MRLLEAEKDASEDASHPTNLMPLSGVRNTQTASLWMEQRA